MQTPNVVTKLDKCSNLCGLIASASHFGRNRTASHPPTLDQSSPRQYDSLPYLPQSVVCLRKIFDAHLIASLTDQFSGSFFRHFRHWSVVEITSLPEGKRHLRFHW